MVLTGYPDQSGSVARNLATFYRFVSALSTDSSPAKEGDATYPRVMFRHHCPFIIDERFLGSSTGRYSGPGAQKQPFNWEIIWRYMERQYRLALPVRSKIRTRSPCCDNHLRGNHRSPAISGLCQSMRRNAGFRYGILPPRGGGGSRYFLR
jgi:hypothetical protein